MEREGCFEGWVYRNQGLGEKGGDTHRSNSPVRKKKFGKKLMS